MEYLKLVKDADIWELPANSWISGTPFTARRKENTRALQHGVIDSGDGKIGGRTVELTIIVNEDSAEAYFAALVAPHAGAWIETVCRANRSMHRMSRPPRGGVD